MQRNTRLGFELMRTWTLGHERLFYGWSCLVAGSAALEWVAMRRLPLALLILALFSSLDVQACSCVGRDPFRQQFERADAVFVGRVVGVKDRFHVFRRLWMYFLDATGRDYERHYGYAYTFSVERVWRGPGARTVTILTGRGGGDCGYPFERGRDYLVYGYRNDSDVWSTDICTRTSEVADAAEDLSLLAALPAVRLDR